MLKWQIILSYIYRLQFIVMLTLKVTNFDRSGTGTGALGQGSHGFWCLQSGARGCMSSPCGARRAPCPHVPAPSGGACMGVSGTLCAPYLHSGCTRAHINRLFGWFLVLLLHIVNLFFSLIFTLSFLPSTLSLSPPLSLSWRFVHMSSPCRSRWP